MIVVVDYGMGNLGSVIKSLNRLKADVLISSSVDDIKKASKLILPGVGHFANGMKRLKEYGYLNILEQKVLKESTPILGICLGMQLFAKHSEEGNTNGLGWIDADIVRFNVENKLKWKIPHMGWNSIKIKKKSIILDGISQDELFYFVHSFYMKCLERKDILSTTEYSYEFTSSIHRNNIYGTQFHPEKSHDKGLKILKNFVFKI
tara:strand:+ start:168 stop:782 length:615 start_codon:yes stop_codon:yes gene_type:complete